MTSRYTLLAKIGEGAYSKVYEAIPGNKVVAIKQFGKSDLEAGLVEHKILSRCTHPQIIQCLGMEQTETTCNLILQHYPRDLRKYLLCVGRIQNEKLVQSYFWQILSGLAYLHETQRLIHTDIKPANMLINSEGNLVLCDFSTSVYEEDFTERQENWRGTLQYRAPECLLGADTETQLCFGTAMDMWSVGCVVHEMLQNRSLFSGDSEIDQLFQIFRLCGTPSEQTWAGVSLRADWKSTFPQWPSTLEQYLQKVTMNEALRDLLRQILVLDPKKRITAPAALKHPYFQGCCWLRRGDAKMAEGLGSPGEGSTATTTTIEGGTETITTLPDPVADSMGHITPTSESTEGLESSGSTVASVGSV